MSAAQLAKEHLWGLLVSCLSLALYYSLGNVATSLGVIGHSVLFILILKYTWATAHEVFIRMDGEVEWAGNRLH